MFRQVGFPSGHSRRPGLAESYQGYRTFMERVEDAQIRKLPGMLKDEKSGQYILRLPDEE